MNRGRLGRYALWQFRDFALERGISILIIGLLYGYLALEPIRRLMGPSWTMNPQLPLSQIVTMLASSIVAISVLIALNGIISNDRKTGYYRFLFAKPVDPLFYYGQLFLVYLAGVVVAMLVLCGLFMIFAAKFNVLYVVLYTILIFISMGGIGFFISAATRYDWVVLAAVWVGSRILRGIFGGSPDWRGKAVQILPPVHKVDDVAHSLIVNGTAHVTDILWFLGYGALFFALGLVVLRRRSMAT